MVYPPPPSCKGGGGVNHCTNISTTDFSLSCELPLDLFCDFQNGPAFSEAMRKKIHWLPYPERVEFKLCNTIYKCMHNSAPKYLIELCIPVATLPGRCHLRSAAYGDLFVPATSTKTIGPRGFFYAGPVAWNSLQPALKDPSLSFTIIIKNRTVYQEL